jgi:DNA-binding MarR family transcriptional regulator
MTVEKKGVFAAKTNGGFLMSQIRHLSERIWEKLLKESGVEIFNGAQGRILYVLWEYGDLTISEIGKMTSLAKTTLTGMLDRMEAGGLITRVPDTKNRRQIFITITEKARDYRDKYDLLSDKMSEAYYRGFKEAEVMDFENQLRKIVKNLETEERNL